MNDPWTRQRLKKIFISLFPDPHHSPRYQKVKKKDPFLYDMIMHRFNGYRAFLKAIKRPMPPTSAKERAFIKYSSNVSKRYYINCWSTLEEYTFAALVLLKEENNFIHNCPFPSPKGSYYQLDFFDFDRMLLIEVDGIFHTAIPGQKERDAERDKYIGSFGIRILRLNSNDFKDLSHLPHIINLFIHPEKYHV